MQTSAFTNSPLDICSAHLTAISPTQPDVCLQWKLSSLLLCFPAKFRLHHLKGSGRPPGKLALHLVKGSALNGRHAMQPALHNVKRGALALHLNPASAPQRWLLHAEHWLYCSLWSGLQKYSGLNVIYWQTLSGIFLVNFLFS